MVTVAGDVKQLTANLNDNCVDSLVSHAPLWRTVVGKERKKHMKGVCENTMDIKTLDQHSYAALQTMYLTTIHSPWAKEEYTYRNFLRILHLQQ